MEPSIEEDSIPVAKFGLRPPTEEVLASLAAVRAARVAAQVRLRRDSRRVRVLTATLATACACGALVVVGHVRGTAAPAIGVQVAVQVPSQVSSGSPAPAPVPAPPLEAPRKPEPDQAVADQASAAAEAELAAERASALAACAEAYEGHRWRSAVEACGAAFQGLPTDAALAMKVAQAQHARGHYADAGVWAHRAIALDGDPEAFVIVAHAERRANNPIAAKEAYRRYLALAPRGWHASEARASLRGSRPVVRPRRTAAATPERSEPVVNALAQTTVE